jgi:hypothetical protein
VHLNLVASSERFERTDMERQAAIRKRRSDFLVAQKLKKGKKTDGKCRDAERHAAVQLLNSFVDSLSRMTVEKALNSSLDDLFMEVVTYGKNNGAFKPRRLRGEDSIDRENQDRIVKILADTVYAVARWKQYATADGRRITTLPARLPTFKEITGGESRIRKMLHDAVQLIWNEDGYHTSEDVVCIDVQDSYKFVTNLVKDTEHVERLFYRYNKFAKRYEELFSDAARAFVSDGEMSDGGGYDNIDLEVDSTADSD